MHASSILGKEIEGGMRLAQRISMESSRGEYIGSENRVEQEKRDMMGERETKRERERDEYVEGKREIHSERACGHFALVEPAGRTQKTVVSPI